MFDELLQVSILGSNKHATTRLGGSNEADNDVSSDLARGPLSTESPLRLLRLRGVAQFSQDYGLRSLQPILTIHMSSRTKMYVISWWRMNQMLP